jgi:hypothetical protein
MTSINDPDMSFGSDKKQQLINRSRDQSPKSSNSDEISSTSSKQSKNKTLHAVPKVRKDPTITQSFMHDYKAGFTYFQDQKLTLAESILLHFKPTSGMSASMMFLLFIFDFVLSLAFQSGHIYFFFYKDFEDESNHMLHILIGAGFTGIILFYSFSDGARSLRSNFDKLLYLISCLLQKPLLLPVLLPSRFRSRIADKHLKTHTVKLMRTHMEEGKTV